jgi:hypothetical protein
MTNEEIIKALRRGGFFEVPHGRYGLSAYWFENRDWLVWEPSRETGLLEIL